MYVCKRDGFTSVFLICSPLISSSCLIVLARALRTLLKKEVEIVDTPLCSDFCGIALSFPPCMIKLVVGLPFLTFILLKYIFSSPILKLITKSFWILSKVSLHLLVKPIHMTYYIYWFMVNLPCISEMMYLIMIDPFYTLPVFGLQVFCWGFCIYVQQANWPIVLGVLFLLLDLTWFGY